MLLHALDIFGVHTLTPKHAAYFLTQAAGLRFGPVRTVTDVTFWHFAPDAVYRRVHPSAISIEVIRVQQMYLVIICVLNGNINCGKTLPEQLGRKTALHVFPVNMCAPAYIYFSQIMDRYDPEKRVALIVDEWGTWHDVEPGTNPGFLYQQNTMRDALVAAITLNIFNRHADRVRMANLAQTVNVLQSVVLTEGSKLVLMPTYYVFDLYKAHQDAELVDCYVETGDVGVEGACVRQVSASASVKDGALTLTAANASCDAPAEIEIELNGIEANAVCGRILTGRMDAKNDFDETNVEIQPFTAMELQTGMDVLLDRKGIAIPDGDFSVDVTLAEDVDLAALSRMTQGFVGADLAALARGTARKDERGARRELLAQEGAGLCHRLRVMDGGPEVCAPLQEVRPGGQGALAGVGKPLCGRVHERHNRLGTALADADVPNLKRSHGTLPLSHDA